MIKPYFIVATPAEVQQFCTINVLRFQNLTHLPAETAPNQSDLTHPVEQGQ